MDPKLQLTFEVLICSLWSYHFFWATQILETWLESAKISKGQQINMFCYQDFISQHGFWLAGGFLSSNWKILFI